MLATGGIQPKIDQSMVAGVSSNPIVPTRSFTRSYFKKLTSYDVESGILILPWYGFGEFAFAFTFSHIVLVDHIGCRYPCSLEFSVDDDGELACKGAVKLPRMFAEDFGEELCRVVTLVDARDNHLEVLVDKIDEDVYFTRGWASVKNFYNIKTGAWVVLIYSGFGHFGITIHDRLQFPVLAPTFEPPMRLVIDKLDVLPHFVDNLSEDLHDLSYAHDERFFDVSLEKTLTYFDVSTGYLMLPYDGFGEYAFHQGTTSIKVVDEYGNAWFCSLIFVSFPCKHYKIGGQWGRLVASRRLIAGSVITIGAQPDANSETLYVILDP
ncbi:unnamed protein product [Trifolium pratense]|uniref:Uncharacterized protein n=1 Tax=Trifolium pratense TaxID=57577 RepID=A0ACB0LUG2_TRIPR|nr:unnamed protein product [Trifolium pratense]